PNLTHLLAKACDAGGRPEQTRVLCYTFAFAPLRPPPLTRARPACRPYDADSPPWSRPMRRPLLLLLLATPAPAAEPVVLHVSPHGLDGATGRPAAPTTGGPTDPFATPGRARDAVRELKAGHGGKLPGPVTVCFHGGTYRLAEPFALTPDDSGSADAPVVYEAAAGGT